MVDLLADEADVIVRYQGGSNAGHTVMFGGETYRLHLVPSGIFRAGKTCVVAHGVVLDAEVFFEEIDDLRARGHEVSSRNLLVSDRAQLVMPWHRRLDQVREAKDGAGKMGTTGRGIGPCYADKVSYRGTRHPLSTSCKALRSPPSSPRIARGWLLIERGVVRHSPVPQEGREALRRRAEARVSRNRAGSAPTLVG